MNNKIYERLTPERKALVDAILAALERGGKDWLQGWAGAGAPRSAITGKSYHGVNRLMLTVAARKKRYTDNRWLTYRQMEEKGWSFKTDEEGKSLGKGAGVPVEYFELRDRETKKPFDRHILDGMTADEKNEYMDKNVYPLRKYYRVFNAEVIEGISALEKREIDPTGYNERADTEEGTLSYRCTQCGASYVAYSLEETGHYYVASTVAATCTSGGYTIYTCTRCGDSYTDNYTNPFGHNYSETYKAASCTEYGETVFTCQICGDSYSEYDGTYPTGHNYTNTVITSPTCTADGILRSVCDECGDTFDTVIAANGHNYTITDIVSSGGITARTYTCTECGESYTQELGDQYEEVANYVEYLFEQYSPYMWWVLLAAAGVWSIVIGVMIAIARKNEDKEKAKKMLVNYVIGLVVIAVIVVACPYLIRGIAALIT